MVRVGGGRRKGVGMIEEAFSYVVQDDTLNMGGEMRE